MVRDKRRKGLSESRTDRTKRKSLEKTLVFFNIEKVKTISERQSEEGRQNMQKGKRKRKVIPERRKRSDGRKIEVGVPKKRLESSRNTKQREKSKGKGDGFRRNGSLEMTRFENLRRAVHIRLNLQPLTKTACRRLSSTCPRKLLSKARRSSS
jgi:hypothetical protein